MKIYQESSFVVTKNQKTVCTINCRLVLFLYGSNEPSLEIAFKEIGVASCNPDDVFDETFGRRLAERRASIKVYRRALRELNKRKRYYNGMLESTKEGTLKLRKLRNYLEKKEYKKK